MRIRSDYVPRAQQRATQRANAVSICPNCGQKIPDAELAQHMKIELLDPRWKEQRNKAEARFSTTNLGGTDVAANLKRLRARTEGGAGDAVALAAAKVLDEQEEEERRKRARLDEVPGVGEQSNKDLSISEQISRIHQLAKSKS